MTILYTHYDYTLTSYYYTLTMTIHSLATVVCIL